MTGIVNSTPFSIYLIFRLSLYNSLLFFFPNIKFIGIEIAFAVRAWIYPFRIF
jgi:hypothetical protein